MSIFSTLIESQGFSRRGTERSDPCPSIVRTWCPAELPLKLSLKGWVFFVGKWGRGFQPEGSEWKFMAWSGDGQHCGVERATIPRLTWPSEGEYFPKTRFPGSGPEIETSRVEPEHLDFKTSLGKKKIYSESYSSPESASGDTYIIWDDAIFLNDALLTARKFVQKV